MKTCKRQIFLLQGTTLECCCVKRQRNPDAKGVYIIQCAMQLKFILGKRLN